VTPCRHCVHYYKELLRRAAVLAAGEDGALVVTQDHLQHARDELASGGALGQRILGFRSDGDVEPPLGMPGFPVGMIQPGWNPVRTRP
jgi:hypothetical protein